MIAFSIINLVGCRSSTLKIQQNTEQSLPINKSIVDIKKINTPRHILFPETPPVCGTSSETKRSDPFNQLFKELDCEEPCLTRIHLPELCGSNNYSSLEELEQQLSWKTVRLGGYFFQKNESQPCSMNKKKCCNSCAEYVVLTDFEDQNDWFKCKRVYMNHDEKSILDLFSMEGSCCTLNDLRFPAIITGKVEKIDEQWYFSEVHSICRIP
jgi:hypothetical protein